MTSYTKFDFKFFVNSKKQYKQYVTEVESSAASSPAEDTSRNSVPAGVAASASVALPVAEKALTGIGIKPPVIQRAAAPQDMSATEEGDAQALEITPAVAALSMHARSFARPLAAPARSATHRAPPRRRGCRAHGGSNGRQIRC